MSLEFNLITENWKKNMWNKKFRKDYEGKLRSYGKRLMKHMLNSNNKYITISNNGFNFGFAKIDNVSDMVVTKFTDQIWCIEEIYINEEYRHKGYAKELIKHLRDNYHAYMIYMQRDRAMRLIDFHNSIGFSIIGDHPTYVDMVHVCYDPSFINTSTIASNDNDITITQVAA